MQLIMIKKKKERIGFEEFLPITEGNNYSLQIFPNLFTNFLLKINFKFQDTDSILICARKIFQIGIA